MSDLGASATVSNALEQANYAALGAAKTKGGKSINGVAEEFEAMFLSQMLAPMWAGLEADGEFDGGSAEMSYRSMLTTEYGKSIAKAGGLGIAAPVKAELIRLQGMQS